MEIAAFKNSFFSMDFLLKDKGEWVTAWGSALSKCVGLANHQFKQRTEEEWTRVEDPRHPRPSPNSFLFHLHSFLPSPPPPPFSPLILLLLLLLLAPSPPPPPPLHYPPLPSATLACNFRRRCARNSWL
eukprot:2928407-Pyramimonas_sp.AAC.1